MTKIYYIIFFCLFVKINAKDNISIEANLGYNFIINNGNFNNFKGLIDCGNYTNGSGNAISYGLGFNYKINSSITSSLNIDFLNTNLNNNHLNSFSTRDLANNKLINANAITNIDSKIQFIKINPTFEQNINQNFFNLNLSYLISPFFAIPLKGNYNQTEQIQSPESAVFIDNFGNKSQFRNITSSDFQTLTSFFGLAIGIKNHIKLNQNINLNQIIEYNKSFTNILSDANWKNDYLTFKLTLEYRFLEAEKVIIEVPKDTIIKLDTIKKIITIEKPKEIPEKKFVNILDAKFKDLNYFELVSLKPQFPIYNLFFEAKSDNLINKDNNNNFIFSNEQIISNLKDVLNEKSKIEFVVYLNKNEIYNQDIFDKRKSKLSKIINDLNLNIQNINIKSDYIKSSTEEIENLNKVDILISNPSYFSERLVRNNLNGTIVLNLNYNVKSDLHINSDLVNYIESDKRDKIEIPFNVDNRIPNKEYEIKVTAEDSLENIFILKPNANYSKTKEIDFSNYEFLVLFDFNSSELTNSNLNKLKEFSKLINYKTIEIYGSTDNTGDSKINEDLANSRANAVASFIKSNSNNTKIEIKQIDNKYPENNPQGKILNRSVKIKVIN